SVGERFADHDQRVETMVAIARELGVDPSVGVMQANFGTPQELGYADLARLVEAFGAGNLSDPRVTAAAEAGRAKAAAALSAATAELTEALASSGDEADPKVAAARAAVAAASAELAAFDRARAA